MIRRLDLALIAALLAPGLAAAQSIPVNGTVAAQWTAPQPVSPSADLVLRPGHAVTVTLSGQVDLNQEQRSRRECSWFGLSCERVYWTEHNWRGPEAAPVRFQIRLAGTSTVIADELAKAAPVTLAVPTGADYATRYELVALLDGAGSSIDPGRSAGTYTVRVAVDAQARANGFTAWLNSARPTAGKATSADILDAALVTGYGARAARSLRAYAASQFPLTQADARDSHGALLRKAAEIAPEDADNSLALANYFRALGLTTQADAELNKAISQLETKTDPRSRVALGRAYAARADAVLAEGGGVQTMSVLEANAYLAKAIAAFTDGGRRDLLADALVRRGRLLRGLRTQDSLAEAIASFKSALDLTPEMVRARLALESPDGKTLKLFDWTEGYAPQPLGGEPDQAAWIADAMAVRWDAGTGKMLETTATGTYQWRAMTPGAAPEPASLIPRDVATIEVSNGSVLSITPTGRASYASRRGLVSYLPFGASEVCSPVSPFSYPFTLGSVGRDDDFVATYCNTTLHLFRIDAGSGVPSKTASVVLAPPGGPMFMDLAVVAGPAGCGAAVSMRRSPTTGGAPVKSVTLVRADGSRIDLAIPAMLPGIFDSSLPVTAFTRDGRVLVLQSFAPIAAFRCSDGAAVPAIATPGQTLVAPPQGGNMPFASLDARWLDSDHLAVSSISSRQLFTIDTQTNSLQTFTTTAPDLTSSPETFLPPFPFSFNNIVIPPMSGSTAVRAIQVLRKAEIRELARPVGNPGPTVFLRGETFAGDSLLGGGHHLLAQFGIVDLRDGTSFSPGANVRIGVINGEDGWSATKLETIPVPASPSAQEMPGSRPPPYIRVTGIETYRGKVRQSSTPLPDLDSSERAAIVTALKQIVSTMPSPPPPDRPFGMPASQYKSIIEEPDRLSAQYMVGITVRSLASSGAGGALLMCPSLFGKTTAGDVLLIRIQPPQGTLRPLMVNFVNGAPVFTRIPQLDCISNVIVDGAKPAFVARLPEDPQRQTLRLKWTRGGTVVDGGVMPGKGVIAQGASLDDGSLLLLLTNAPANNANHTLIRLLPGGGQAQVCTACSSIAVWAAAEALSQKLRDTTAGRGQAGIPSFNTDGIVKVDATGKVLARPDDDETVIESLVTGRELLRLRLGRVLVLREDLAIVDTGEAKLQVHRLGQN